MLSLQAAVISVALFTALFSAYSHASGEVGKTKQALLQAMDKKFFEKNTELLIYGVLEEKGPCLDRKKAAVEKLVRLAQELKSRGIEMKTGYASTYWEGEQVSEMLTCTQNGLAILNSRAGLPGIFFTRLEDKWQYTTVVR
ncbi:hypothetical protein HY571_02070 [Candidatus Micrarchaeota archaeon]|nr:hypothetical protein [Candidatus Micrarchaeota archaeon]